SAMSWAHPATATIITTTRRSDRARRGEPADVGTAMAMNQALTSSEVHCEQRLALMGIMEAQKVHSLVVGAAGGAGLVVRRLACFTIMKTTKPMMTKLMTALMKTP